MHQSPITLWLYFKPVRPKEKEFPPERLTVSQSQTFLLGDRIRPPPYRHKITDTFVEAILRENDNNSGGSVCVIPITVRYMDHMMGVGCHMGQ